jgi:predicted transcriptional regulator
VGDDIMTVYRFSGDNAHNTNAAKVDAKKARCQTEIIARILELCIDGGTKKTHIMYRANLSHEMMKSYLDRLLKCKLLEKSDEEPRSIFMTTAKGKEFLYHYSLMQTLTVLDN